MIDVRRAVPADRDAILAFIARAYGDRSHFKLPPRWDWAFGEPLQPEPGLLPMVIAVEPTSGNVVGQSCFVTHTLRLDGEDLPMMWGADGFLLPSYRGQGLGYEMQRQLHAMGRIFMSLNLSDANRRIKLSLGSIELPPVTIFVRRLRFAVAGVRRRLVAAATSRGLPGEFSNRLIGSTGIDRLLTTALNLRSSRRRGSAVSPTVHAPLTAVSSAPSATGLHIRVVQSFDESFDRLWCDVRGEIGAGVERSASYLAWKFMRQPGMAYKCLAAFRNDALVGYVVFRAGSPPEGNRGVVADMLARPADGEAMSALLDATIERLSDQGVEDIEAAHTEPAYQEALRSAGFRGVGESVPMFYAADRTRVLYGRANGWFIGRADSDWDQYPCL